ncbi:MAG: leucyl/phenylalanyl-tRNA--protein transferase, partial [Ferruginibacter sp.]|nr:leucyl/phenylalanyl-tRNA--protein transferase [Ferruginibacter sp.]
FPDPALAEPNGLLAIGGDLSPERLIAAYQNGIFPWFGDDEPICWYTPHERCVIFPAKIHIGKSMQKIMRAKEFTVTTNTAFAAVIAACKNTERKDQDGTWITDDMEAAYIKLHELGIAKSIEVWRNNELVGGIYGLKINEMFCGESMFSLVSNASKTALVWLCKENNYSLIDCQLRTDHLTSMGAEMISRKDYLRILKQG